MNLHLNRAALAAALLLSGLAAAPAPQPTAPSTPNAAVLARARTWFHALQIGKVDRTELNDQVNGLLTDATVKQLATQLGPLGDPVTFEQLQTGVQAGSTYYVYKMTFKDGDVFDFVFAYQGDGKVSGLRIVPAQ